MGAAVGGLLLALAMGAGWAGCAGVQERTETPHAVRELPPDYREKVLEEREGLERQLQHYSLSLESIETLIRLREPGRIQRGPGGTVFLSDGSALRRRRFEIERQYDQTLGALLSLENRLRREPGGSLPSWWKPFQSP